MSRAQLDQYAEKFKANPAKAAREGKEIEVKPDEVSQPFDPKKLQGSSISSNAGTRSGRGANAVAQDAERGNAQGDRAPVPANLRARYDAYKKSLSRAPANR
jgi:hypothetical protein